jgi:hypothetical protein
MEELLSLLQGTPKTQQYYLRKALEGFNQERNAVDEPALPLPDELGEDGNPVESTDVELWNQDVSTSTVILRRAGVRTREGGVGLTVGGLRRRLRQVWEDKAVPKYFEPSAAGINMREYWLPIVLELIQGALIIAGTIVLSRYLYIWAEYYHEKWDCVSYAQFYSMWCFTAKKSRAYLEDLNYNMVYTALIGCGAFASKILMTYQKQFNKYFQ